jgi:hypothetical protein
VEKVVPFAIDLATLLLRIADVIIWVPNRR